MKQIILDIDGTLIDNDADENIYPRPYLENFLVFLFTDKRIESVSLWTAASQEWLNEVLDKCLKDLLPQGKEFKLKWCKNRCTSYKTPRYLQYYTDNASIKETISVKPLKKIWKCKSLQNQFNKNNTIIIDDTPLTFCQNYGNGITIQSFDHNNQKDRQLIALMDYLDRVILDSDNIRSIEKRQWNFSYQNYFSNS